MNRRIRNNDDGTSLLIVLIIVISLRFGALGETFAVVCSGEQWLLSFLALAIAAILLAQLAAFGFGFKWIAASAATGALADLDYERAINLDSGVSPLVPELLIGMAVIAGILTSIRRRIRLHKLEDSLGLARLRERYAGKMGEGSEHRSFDVITEPVDSSGTDFRAAAQVTQSTSLSDDGQALLATHDAQVQILPEIRRLHDPRRHDVLGGRVRRQPYMLGADHRDNTLARLPRCRRGTQRQASIGADDGCAGVDIHHNRIEQI